MLRPAFLDLASSFHLFVEMKGKTKERRKADELLVRLAAALGPRCLKVTSRERQPVGTKSEGKYYKIKKGEGKERERERERQHRKWEVFQTQSLKLHVWEYKCTKVTGKRKKENERMRRVDTGLFDLINKLSFQTLSPNTN